MLLDPDSKLIVTWVVGRRTAATASEAVADFYRRTEGEVDLLISSDADPVYLSVIININIYGVSKHDLEFTAPQKVDYDREGLPEVLIPEELCDATVHKHREQGRVVKIEKQRVLGKAQQRAALQEQGTSAATINTSYVERYHATHRHQNARKARKVYTFSKEVQFHRAATWLCGVAYNFGWLPRTLRIQVQEQPPRYHDRTPARAAKLTEDQGTLKQILTRPMFKPKHQDNATERSSKEQK